jgi:predicted transposase YdaD
MNVDTLLKYLAERYPDHLAAWLLGRPIDGLGPVEVLKGELSAEQVRADFVAIVRSLGTVLHVEFQYSPPGAGEPSLELRMLDYWVRLHRRYRLPVEQVLVLIRPTTRPTGGLFEVGRTRHEFRVVRLWEEDPAALLADEALLPLATLARATDPRALMSTVAERVRRIEPSARRMDIGTLAQLLAGLVISVEEVRAMFGEDILEHSSVYQEILRRGEARGRAVGEAHGRAEGEAHGRAMGEREGAELLLLGVLESRFGAMPADIRATLDRCPLTTLRALAGAATTAPSIEAFGQAAAELAPAA